MRGITAYGAGEDWFIVENTHEAIIDQETFDKVQGLLKRDTRTPPKAKQLYLFQRLLEMRRLRQGDVLDRFKRHLCLLPMRNI